MDSPQIHARTAGALFLLAIASSLTGGGLLESIIGVPEFLSAIFHNEYVLKTGILMEIVSALSVIGIAVVLFPVLKPYSERIALGYFAFRLVESIVCVFAAFIPILTATLVTSHARVGIPDGPALQNFGALLLVTRTMIVTLMVPLFFSLGALLFYSFLYQFRLVPRFISVWGFAGTLLILISTFISIKGTVQVICVLPIILNEIFLGIWLLVKGFRQDEDQNVKPDSYRKELS